ncbi:hypothetical protein ACIBFB_12605 [Nocardiopsis sp. NPDC050513]|uniref:hypothetical protein n=1 Tax=Nocardiopsis sp. NPDC050513 TaxID=3364338 RepID=UPI003790A69A
MNPTNSEYKVRYTINGETCVKPMVEVEARREVHEDLRARGAWNIAFRKMQPAEIDAHLLGYTVVWDWRKGDGFQRCDGSGAESAPQPEPRSSRKGVAQPKAVVYDDPNTQEKGCQYAASGRKAAAIARELKAASILAVEVRPVTRAEAAKLASGELEYTEPEGS